MIAHQAYPRERGYIWRERRVVRHQQRRPTPTNEVKRGALSQINSIPKENFEINHTTMTKCLTPILAVVLFTAFVVLIASTFPGDGSSEFRHSASKGGRLRQRRRLTLNFLRSSDKENEDIRRRLCSSAKEPGVGPPDCTRALATQQDTENALKVVDTDATTDRYLPVSQQVAEHDARLDADADPDRYLTSNVDRLPAHKEQTKKKRTDLSQ